MVHYNSWILTATHFYTFFFCFKPTGIGFYLVHLEGKHELGCLLGYTHCVHRIVQQHLPPQHLRVRGHIHHHAFLLVELVIKRVQTDGMAV